MLANANNNDKVPLCTLQRQQAREFWDAELILAHIMNVSIGAYGIPQLIELGRRVSKLVPPDRLLNITIRTKS